MAFTAISSQYGFNVTIPQVLAVTIPASLAGLLCAAACSYRRGLDLDKDPDFKKRCADPAMYSYMYGSDVTTLDRQVSPAARRAVYVFICALCVIVALAVFPALLPTYVSADGGTPERLKMNVVIQIVMLSAAALMVIVSGAKPKKAVGGTVWQSGMVAVVAIYGIAWLADTYFSNYMTEIQPVLGGIVTEHKWAIALVFFLTSMLLNSQGAVVVSMLPLAYSLGLPGYVMLGVLPSVYGYFFIPNYPSDIATVNFDRSGTTVIGRYLLNHSFMMPGLVCVGVATIVGYLLATAVYG